MDQEKIQAEYKTLKKALQEEQAQREANTSPDDVLIRVLYPDAQKQPLAFGLRHEASVTDDSVEVQIEVICVGEAPITDCDLLVVPPTCTSVDEVNILKS